MKASFIDYVRGAAAATELANTSPEVRASGEAIVDPDALARFLAGHGVRVGPTAADVGQVRALRGEVRTVIEAPEDLAAEGANALVARAGLGPVLERDVEGRWQWYVATSPDASLADELAVLMGTGLLGALRTLGHDRFRPCASPVCNGLYVDTSRAGRRRYCMPDICGNRLNVANHRARRRTGA